ncbi:cobalamin biosynthesis protein [Roseospira marina]|uniref:Cobalamin biosynthesis protein CobD n=1 Tax=Roseospira marina TaxID=140057 RepID=A0A5M6ICK5_9PROT|nr:adenosylcobinamide-phosphate synthase CbiB [Roseospira marina]KAA5605475.1 cobalamin biosynthesis protein [Roseospira marina]MBB4314523.1 adenosylcobinamide-phosphate synthase [Roseospira marina]MBB5088649.1 adenosylcobinamide-phosphate synthase [Roseospira marina]
MFLLFDYTGTDVFDPLVLLLAAMAIDAYLGEFGPVFRLLPHPVVLMGHAIGDADGRLNRPERSPTDRRIRGVVTAVGLIAAAAGIGVAVQWFATQAPAGWVLELLLVAVMLAQKSLYDHVRDVAVAVERHGLDAGRKAIRHLCGRDPETLDQGGIGRAAIESLAENFSDGVVAPIFWYVVFGLPGLLAYKMINTLDSMIGHKTERHQDFGWAAARIDDVANWIPARLSGALIIGAAATLRFARWREAVRILRRDARRHRSPNAGWPEAATAGALGLALSGPRYYHGHETHEPWVGDGRAGVRPKDIRRALRLYVRACLGGGLAVAVVLVVKLAVVGAG